MELDTKDRRILLELDTDASQTLKQIARKLRTSKEVVAYRIKQLEKAGIISNFTAIYNSWKLGLMYYMIYVKFAHITEEKKQEIVDFVRNGRNFGWMSLSEGTFDMMIGAHFPSVTDFEKYRNEFFSRFDMYFQKDAFALLTEGESYPRQYVLGGKQDKVAKTSRDFPMRKVFKFTVPSEKEKLDTEDLRILKMLAENSRQPLTDMAKILGMTERVVPYRKRMLEKKGVIVGYKLFIDSRELNYTLFKCLIKLHGAGQKRFNDLLGYARQHPNVIYWEKTLGEWDIELHIEVSSPEEFYSIANDVRYKFSDVVRNFDTLLVTEDAPILEKHNNITQK